MNEIIEKQLELRMYFFTVSSLCGISKGIACGHASLEYAYLYGQSQEFIDFIQQHKTWIILNGGTTNDERDLDDKPLGTLNQIGDALDENDIKFSHFREPDLNHALTALCFIADERVFNKKDFHDFKDFLSGISKSYIEANNLTYDETKERYHTDYKEWIRGIGGIKNEFLRDLIKDKKLA